MRLLLGAATMASVLGCGGDDEPVPSTTSVALSTTTAPTDVPASSTTSASTDPTTSSTSPSTSTSGGAPPPGELVPGMVSEVRAAPGGGSGEVELAWDAVADATGYRVLRSGDVAGPFEVVADLDITTGATTVGAGVVNVTSDQRSYVPSDGTFDGPDGSAGFRYVDVGGGRRCYQVVSYNLAGEGAASAAACGSPP